MSRELDMGPHSADERFDLSPAGRRRRESLREEALGVLRRRRRARALARGGVTLALASALVAVVILDLERPASPLPGEIGVARRGRLLARIEVVSGRSVESVAAVEVLDESERRPTSRIQVVDSSSSSRVELVATTSATRRAVAIDDDEVIAILRAHGREDGLVRLDDRAWLASDLLSSTSSSTSRASVGDVTH